MLLLTLPEKIQRALNLPQLQYIYDSLPKSATAKPWEKRDASAITEIVVHHAGAVSTIINEAKYHINTNKWHTISYHISIDRGGIFQLNDLLSVTHQAKSANPFSIGVCINWNLVLRPPTEFEMNALIGVILALKELFPNAKVSGHNEIGKRYGYGTACPVISMNKLREDIMTAELKVAISDTPNDQLAKAVAVVARVEDLRVIAYDPKHKYNPEALRKMNRFYDILVSEGLIKVTQPS